jgi:hypothetical protein
MRKQRLHNVSVSEEVQCTQIILCSDEMNIRGPYSIICDLTCSESSETKARLTAE